jgi:hypothetical protein
VQPTRPQPSQEEEAAAQQKAEAEALVQQANLLVDELGKYLEVGKLRDAVKTHGENSNTESLTKLLPQIKERLATVKKKAEEEAAAQQAEQLRKQQEAQQLRKQQRPSSYASSKRRPSYGSERRPSGFASSKRRPSGFASSKRPNRARSRRSMNVCWEP